MSALDAWDSTPFLNIIFLNPEASVPGSSMVLADYYKYHLTRMSVLAKNNSVELCKLKLGKQSYCWTGEYRNWIWEDSGWRVFVNNVQGICFEVDPKLSFSQSVQLYVNFVNKIK